MTLIAAVRGKRGPAIMAGDSFLGLGDSTVHDVQSSPKILRVCHGKAWLGLAGDPSTLGNAIWALEELDLRRFDLRRDLRHYMKKKDVPVDTDLSALLVHGRKLWALDDSWAAHPIGRNFTAIGVGRDFAMGCFSYAAHRGELSRDPEGVLRRVMVMTSKMVDGVRSPFDYSDNPRR